MCWYPWPLRHYALTTLTFMQKQDSLTSAAIAMWPRERILVLVLTDKDGIKLMYAYMLPTYGRPKPT